MIIHQIYGLYDDGKPMNTLFSQGSIRWRDYCANLGYTYVLWDKYNVEELINTYTDIKAYYYSVKYPIMKVDIARFLILYQFGGLYVDLDVVPNTNKDFIEDKEKLHMCNYLWTHKNMVKTEKESDLEMVYSPKYNQDLYKWLKHLPSVIESKDKIEVYKEWVIRYIFHTTGPPAFRKFMKQNKIEWLPIDVVALDQTYKFGDLDGVNVNEKFGNQDYKCVSYFSMSYNPHKKDVSYRKKKTLNNDNGSIYKHVYPKQPVVQPVVDTPPTPPIETEVKLTIEEIVEDVVEEVSSNTNSDKLDKMISLLEELVKMNKNIYNIK
mgnify:CR=1 FL=1